MGANFLSINGRQTVYSAPFLIPPKNCRKGEIRSKAAFLLSEKVLYSINSEARLKAVLCIVIKS